MTGQIHIIGKETYLQMNENGTLEKLPMLKWWQQLYFYIYSRIHGGVSLDWMRMMALDGKKK